MGEKTILKKTQKKNGAVGNPARKTKFWGLWGKGSRAVTLPREAERRDTGGGGKTKTQMVSL